MTENLGGAKHDWIVLTPSVDDRAWRAEINRAAKEFGLVVIGEADLEHAPDGAAVVVLTDDALRPLTVGARRVAAIIPEPESSPEAVADRYALEGAQRDHHAALLLARALSLATEHRVVTAQELATRPRQIELLDLRLSPPESGAEVSRNPPLTNAFKIYRAAGPALPSPVPWSEDLFLFETKAASAGLGLGVLDITGRPRMLVNGPYFFMPPGSWRACIRFGVDKDAAKHQYRLDWGTMTACVSEYVTPRQPGVYELELDYTWDDVAPAEIRLILTEGSFMGTLLFQGMTVRPVPDHQVTGDQEAA